ncbi:MAG: hypothetical protein ACPGUH_08960 [Winogradskyella sp.]
MKNIKHLLLPFVALCIITSCSNDDTPTNDDVANEGNFFPSTVNDFWKYDVSNTNNATNETTMSQDSLYVVSETDTNFTLGVNNGLPANGAVLALMTSGDLTRTNTTLTLDGSLDLPSEITELIDFDINLVDFLLYNTEAANATELASYGNTITQNFNGIPLTITYQLTSTSLGFTENLTLNNVAYTDVVSSKLTLAISITASVEVVPGFPIDIAILESQDILDSTNYFAKNIGLVHADSAAAYQINPLAVTAIETALGTDFPIPASGSSTITQVLVAYDIAE